MVPPPITMRAPPAALPAATCVAWVGAREEVGAGPVVMTVAVRRSLELEPPRENTISCEAVPPFDEVGVPPTVIATCSCPFAVNTVGPLAMGLPLLNFHSTLPVFRSNARRSPSPPPANPRPAAVTVTPPRSGSGVSNFQTRFPLETSIALIDPWSCQFCSAEPKLPFDSPR